MVGSRSTEQKVRFDTLPALITPGYRIRHALRVPPSKPVPFASRYGVLPEWLPYTVQGPLSDVKITKVLSSTPDDLSAFVISPTDQSISIMTSPYSPAPDLPLN